MARVLNFLRGRVNLSVVIDDDRIQLSLGKLADRLTDLRRFWIDYFAPQFFDDIQKNFASSGRFVGGWRALSPRYAAWKMKHYGPLPILVRGGTLSESLRIGGRGNVIRALKMRGEFGSQVPYLPFHQRGTRRMPKRQVLFLGNSRTYQRLLNSFLRDEMNASGFQGKTA